MSTSVQGLQELPQAGYL